MPLEAYVVSHCAPTLASLKVGGLFALSIRCPHTLQAEVYAFNRQLAGKGVVLQVMRTQGNRALCYVYRRTQLERLLNSPAEAAFLRAQGYSALSVDTALQALRQRIAASAQFPHEIGLFLGYPLSDVVGFIQNRGRNCLCSGCWKAYTDACGAMRAFARFKKCTQVYKRLYQAGRTLTQLTVAA